MTPSLTVGLLWLLFSGTHIGLAARPVRERLVRRLGEIGFTAVYFAVASATFAALVATYAALRDAGAPGPGLGSIPTLRPPLIAVVALGIVLVVAGLAPYPGSSYALFRTTTRPEPRGFERITRHPFFVGTALLGAGHALLASHLVGVVFFGGLALFALGGARHQDRKLLAARGAAHATFVARTSVVPFAAILAGRQRLDARDLGPATLALGALSAWALRAVHPSILAHGGAYVVIAVVGGALVAGLQSWQRAGMRGRGRIEQLLGPALVAVGAVHTAATLVFFPDGVAAIVGNGVAGAISDASAAEAKAAFWFGLFGPALVFFGWLTSHALVRDDRALLGLVTWFLVGTSLVGVVVMPASGFWLVLAIGLLALRVATPRPCNTAERPL